jgi:hypothetical protein
MNTKGNINTLGVSKFNGELSFSLLSRTLRSPSCDLVSSKEAFSGVRSCFELETEREILMFHIQIKIHKPTICPPPPRRFHK